MKTLRALIAGGRSRGPAGFLNAFPSNADPEPIAQILAHIGEPTSAPPLLPARELPQSEFSLGPNGAKQDEAAQESSPDDLDQTAPFDPAEPEPIPDDDFDQSWGA